MSGRRAGLLMLLASLLIAGVVSLHASSSPDGLNRVAEQTGFADREQSSPASRSPLADYSTRGVEDERLSGGFAGVAGSLLVLGIGGGLFWLLRRRKPSSASSSDPFFDRSSERPAGEAVPAERT